MSYYPFIKNALTVSGLATPAGNALGSGVVNFDFSAAGLQIITVSGGTFFSGINHIAGGAITMRVYATAGGGQTLVQQLAFATGWRFVSAMPTGLLVNKAMILTAQCFDATDSGVCAAASVQA